MSKPKVARVGVGRVYTYADGSFLASIPRPRGQGRARKRFQSFDAARAWISANAPSIALRDPLVLLAVAERPDRLDDAQALATEVHRLARAHDCAAATYVAEGAPAPTILETAAKTGAALLAVGSHGHGLFRDRVIGTTAALLLAHSPLPLLLVR